VSCSPRVAGHNAPTFFARSAESMLRVAASAAVCGAAAAAAPSRGSGANGTLAPRELFATCLRSSLSFTVSAGSRYLIDVCSSNSPPAGYDGGKAVVQFSGAAPASFGVGFSAGSCAAVGSVPPRRPLTSPSATQSPPHITWQEVAFVL